MDSNKLSFIHWITLNGTTYYFDESYLETQKKITVGNKHNKGHTNIEIDDVYKKEVR